MSNKNFFLVFLVFLIPVFGISQVTKFMGRYAVSTVDVVNDSTWLLSGDFIDLTGSYTALDADTGDKIIQRGYDDQGKMVYDRYRIVGVILQTTTQLNVNVRSDYSIGILNNGHMPSSGSFPISAAVNDTSILTYRTSFYQNQIDFDYDAALDNLNLQEVNLQQQGNNNWAREIANDSENNWILPFQISSTSVIIYNGTPLRSGQWSGSGSSTLVVNVSVKKYDHLTLIN